MAVSMQLLASDLNQYLMDIYESRWMQIASWLPQVSLTTFIVTLATNAVQFPGCSL